MREIPILKIYEKYGTPSNLQEHMLRAAALSSIMCNNWKGPQIDRERIITVMLLHDMGNIVKMNLTKKEYLPPENQDINYWKDLQNKYIMRYGTDDHIVTYNILFELGLEKDYLWLVLNKIFINNEMIANSDNYELIICAYADQRTGPQGIVTLQERFEELRRRYGNNPQASINHPRVQYLIDAAYKIEAQILQYTTINISKITNSEILLEMESLSKYKVKVKSEELGI